MRTTTSRRRRSTKKKSSNQQQQAPACNDWSNLPPDILASIASRLLVTEETIFRSACKDWRSAPNCRLLPSESDFSDPSCPWLFYFLGNTSNCRVFNPLCAKSFNLVFPSQLAGHKIHCHNDGWLLMLERHTHNLLLFNPLTAQIVDEIPERPPFLEGFTKISFTFPSSSKECTIVALDYHVANHLMAGGIGIWKRGNPEWECYRLREDRINFTFYQSDWGMISHGKRYYCLAANGSVGTFHVNSPQQTWTVWDIPLDPNSPVPIFYNPCYLVEDKGGAILGVFESVNQRKIKVFRLNLKQQLWEEVKHLGNQMLFLSNGRCFSQQTRRKKLRNKIFFPKFEADTYTYVFYCLTTNKFASFNGKFSSPIACGFTNIQQSCWFRPATVLDKDIIVSNKVALSDLQQY